LKQEIVLVPQTQCAPPSGFAARTGKCSSNPHARPTASAVPDRIRGASLLRTSAAAIELIYSLRE